MLCSCALLGAAAWRTSLLFEVYRGEAHPGDASEIVGKRGTHVQELLHPYRAVDPDVKNIFTVEIEYLRMLC
jgi:hypothetical protein